MTVVVRALTMMLAVAAAVVMMAFGVFMTAVLVMGMVARLAARGAMPFVPVMRMATVCAHMVPATVPFVVRIMVVVMIVVVLGVLAMPFKPVVVRLAVLVPAFLVTLVMRTLAVFVLALLVASVMLGLTVPTTFAASMIGLATVVVLGVSG